MPDDVAKNQQVDPKADSFSSRLNLALSNAALVTMVSVGHRTGLFEAMADAHWRNLPEIASEAGLAEAYVREWLASMVASRVVEFDPVREKYAMPIEHSRYLTADGVKNFAATSQVLAILSNVEEDMVVRFRDGMGLTYDHFERIHEVMAEESCLEVQRSLISNILLLDPPIFKMLQSGIEVLDIGCGAGVEVLHLARAFPKSRFVGVDVCKNAFLESKEEAHEDGLNNVTFMEMNASDHSKFGEYDLIIAFNSLGIMKSPAATISAVRKSLRCDGVFLLRETDVSVNLEASQRHPLSTYFYAISCLHNTPISIGQGGIGEVWGVEKAREYLSLAGFEVPTTQRLSNDTRNVYFVSRPAVNASCCNSDAAISPKSPPLSCK